VIACRLKLTRLDRRLGMIPRTLVALSASFHVRYSTLLSLRRQRHVTSPATQQKVTCDAVHVYSSRVVASYTISSNTRTRPLLSHCAISPKIKHRAQHQLFPSHEPASSSLLRSFERAHRKQAKLPPLLPTSARRLHKSVVCCPYHNRHPCV